MSQLGLRGLRHYPVASAVLVAALMLSACTPGGAMSADSDTLEVTGKVDSTEIVVAVPTLGPAIVNLNAGFVAPADTDLSSTSSNRSPAPATSVLRVAKVHVSLGQTVAANGTLVTFASAELESLVSAAKADVDVASAQVKVLTASVSDIDNRRNSLPRARGQIDQAITNLTRQRTTVAANLAAARQRLAALTNTSATPTRQAARAKIQDMIGQLSGALTSLDAGLAKARAQRNQLDSAYAQLTTARDQLSGLKRLAQTGLDAAKVGVSQAEHALASAVVTAPSAGVVVRLPHVGDLLAAGATLVVLAEPQLTLTTWLPVADAARLCIGDRATVSADWLTSSRTASVAAIGVKAEYPPSSQASKDVHLTRAIRVSVRVDGTDGLPPGGPTDIRLTRRPLSDADSDEQTSPSCKAER